MKALRFYGIGDVRTEDIDMVEPKQGEALIKVLYGGVCGSDLHIYRAGMFVEKIPETMGHEFVGVIESAPVDSGLVKGDMVLADPRVTCGKCYGCIHGLSQSCSSLGFIGEVRPGCFAEYLAIEPEKIIKIAPHVEPKQAAVAEPIAVALHAAARIAQSQYREALVVGGGPIGLLIGYLLKHHHNFQKVVIADIDEYRRKVAKTTGVDDVVADAGSVAGDFPILVDVVGFEKVIHSLLENARPRTEIYISAVYEKIPLLDLNTIVGKEIKVVGNQAYDFNNLLDAVKLLESGKYDFNWIISRILPAEEGAEAFKLLTASEKHDSKILLQF